ncbi:MAG TPA: carbohydrate-binding protein [Verrucomicrobiae bacterium]|nr:carbohydrate-binding protein [Verrucomicrobiae bacterium]
MSSFPVAGMLLVVGFHAVNVGNAAEFHVAVNGNDANAGAQNTPFRTIQHAADLAQPGDVITVHEGVYRERVTPPRGGTSDKQRIVYRAAPGEQVVITGSEPVKGWERVTNDTWRVTIPNAFFGKFNPYADLIHGDWYGSSRPNHTGAVYLNGDWLTEAARLDEVLAPAGGKPLWFATVDGADRGDYLLNMASFAIGKHRIAADAFAARSGELHAAPCTEGGNCIGWIRSGSWLRFDAVDFSGADRMEFRAASVTDGGDIEVHLDAPDGEWIGTASIAGTGDWQKWNSFLTRIKPVRGVKTVFLVFKAHQSGGTNTTIWAQFPGVNPNGQSVEINVRRTVFTPEKTGINYLTVRGFDLRNAATPWAPPTAAQIGLISAYWCKGWIIESNRISHSTCSGVALGKYGDEWDNRAESAEGYVGTLTRALTNGWNRATIGSHIVRNNEISHCEQTGIVGSLGCSFSAITGNDIHDIHVRGLFGGAEMAGIKFHGAIDVIISHNHIYRCGSVAGIWLDWMAQGAQVTGNLLHDNSSQDIFFEMQHGPVLVANNLFLSKPRSFELNSQGIAFAHNLILGPIKSYRGDTRSTPFHPAHKTDVAGLYPAAGGDSGDHRLYNNLFLAPSSLQALDNTALPCVAAGNVFTTGTQPSKFDTSPLLKPDFDPGVRLTQKPDGWYLTLREDRAWRDEVKRQLVTTGLLGKTRVSHCTYENRDGTPLKIDADYLGQKRDEHNPFPGPFENIGNGPQEIKVWPVASE